MTCFLEGKVCVDKTIHLISCSFPLPYFLLENMHMGLDVSSRRDLGVSQSHGLWVPLSGSPALQHIKSSPQHGVIYKLGKRALVGSCRSLIRVSKMTRPGTDSCSTLLATGFQVLSNSDPLAHLVVTSPLPD